MFGLLYDLYLITATMMDSVIQHKSISSNDNRHRKATGNLHT